MDRRTFTKGLAASAGAPLLVPFAVRCAGRMAAAARAHHRAVSRPAVRPTFCRASWPKCSAPMWKQPIIIENRTGAGGNIGAEHVAQSKPDGYTLMSTPAPPLAVNQNLYPKLNFDPTKFKPITILATSPNVIGVSNKLGVNSVKELIEKAKANEGKLNVANQGNGSTSHLTAAMFESRTGVKFNHVPYRGTAPALNDLVAGHVDVFFDNISSSLPQHQGGNIKILAVAQKERASQIAGRSDRLGGGDSRLQRHRVVRRRRARRHARRHHREDQQGHRRGAQQARRAPQSISSRRRRPWRIRPRRRPGIIADRDEAVGRCDPHREREARELTSVGARGRSSGHARVSVISSL